MTQRNALASRGDSELTYAQKRERVTTHSYTCQKTPPEAINWKLPDIIEWIEKTGHWL